MSVDEALGLCEACQRAASSEAYDVMKRRAEAAEVERNEWMARAMRTDEACSLAEKRWTEAETERDDLRKRIDNIHRLNDATVAEWKCVWEATTAELETANGALALMASAMNADSETIATLKTDLAAACCEASDAKWERDDLKARLARFEKAKGGEK